MKTVNKDIPKVEAGGSSFALAVAVIQERIRDLPKDDRDDLYSLLPLLFHEDAEEQAAAHRAVNEILEQQPAIVRKVNVLAQAIQPLQKWIDFVSERIRRFRLEAGMTQEDLAHASGIPQSHISRLENAEHSPTAKTLARIAEALNVPLSALDPSARTDDDVA